MDLTGTHGKIMSKKEERLKAQQEFIDEKGIICFENVSKSYSAGVAAVDNVNLSIKRGEFVFIVGENGAGKSTLFRMILRELKASEGNVYVMGQDVGKLRHRQIPKFRRQIGVVFQDFRLLTDRNVYENVAFAQRILEVPTEEIRRNVPTILATVGLAGKYKAKIRELSGGEQQRVALARALINAPAILLADEPTGNLDPQNAWGIMELLEEINAQGTTVIMITHNREIVNSKRKRVITLKKGVIVNDQEEGEYFEED